MAETNLTPIGLGTNWFSPSSDIPDPLLQNWLLHTGSLTERLQANCRNFEVKVLFQDYDAISSEEAQTLYTNFGENEQPTQIREVLLVADGIPWVFARSLLPKGFLEDGMQQLADLGDKPLGKIIFNDERFCRQEFQLTRWLAPSPLQELTGLKQARALWGRRSLFSFSSYRMMVAEVFLPRSPAYSQMVKDRM